MPARDIRDQQQGVEAPPQEGLVGPTPVPGLIVPEAKLQQVAVEIVLSDFHAAEAARNQRDYGQDAKGVKFGYETWRKKLTDLYFGHRLPKTVPWRFCSNRSLMIAMAILEVLHARILPAVYNEELTRWRPTESTDQLMAERIEKLMFWWIRVRVKLREFFDRWVRYCIAYGRVTTVSSWDVALFDKGEVSTQAGLDGPMATKVLDRLERSRSDIIPDEDVFLIPGLTDLQRDPVILRRKYIYRDLEDMEREGKLVNITTSTDLLTKSLKDSLIVTAANADGLDPDQQEELENIKRRNLPVECLEAYENIDLDADGFPEPVRVLVEPKYRIYLGALPVKDLSKRGLRHVDVTLYMPRLDEPQGAHGMGVLEQVLELSDEIDALFNQMTDGNSLSVLKPGFYDPAGDVDAPALTLSPNRMTPVSRPQESVYFPEINVPTEKLIMAVRLVMEFIERLTASGTVIFGREPETSGGSGTATRTEAIIGAAQQRFAIPVERLREGAARIMTHHLDLLQTRADEGDDFLQALEARVLGDAGQPIFGQNELTTEGIAHEFDAYLLPDESLGSKESERQLSQLLYTLLTQNLIVASDPAKLYKLTADLLKAWGKDPTQYLGPAPDIAAQASPEEEHQRLLQGDLASIKASVLQNPIEHIMKHQLLPQSPVFQALDPQLQQQLASFMDSHIAQHVQQMELMVTAASKTHQGGVHGSRSPGAPGRAAQPAHAVGPEPGVGSVQSPLAQTRSTQGVGESLAPAAG